MFCIIWDLFEFDSTRLCYLVLLARHAHTPHPSGPQDPSRTLLGTGTRRPDIKTDLRSGFHAQWEAYQAVNGHFAAAVARVARPNDLVWVHWLHHRRWGVSSQLRP